MGAAILLWSCDPSEPIRSAVVTAICYSDSDWLYNLSYNIDFRLKLDVVTNIVTGRLNRL